MIGPCSVSDCGVGNCGNDIGGCRLEAFDGVDRTSVISIAPADSIETRVVRTLQRLQTLNPQGDWTFFIGPDGKPKWDRIVISGISHGASTAGLIAKVKPVERAVMLSGPLDTNQAWLTGSSLTLPVRQYGFTHSVDVQHPGHLGAFAALMPPARRSASSSPRARGATATGSSRPSTQATPTARVRRRRRAAARHARPTAAIASAASGTSCTACPDHFVRKSSRPGVESAGSHEP